jgi:hypothetical protein
LSTAPPAAVRISALDAAQQALAHTRRHLFPFRFERWLALGFVAFLDQCGRTQAGFSNSPSWVRDKSGGGGEEGPAKVLNEAGAWLAAHVMVVMAIAAVALVLILCVTALVLWLNSRGVFMYVDNVATGRSDVSRPWREHAGKADSYFAWSFGLTVGALTAGIVLLVTAAVVAIPMARGHGGIAARVAALVALLGMFLILVLVASLASLALRDFVAPLQMKMGGSCGAAIDVFLGLLRAHGGTFAIYVLLKIVFALVMGVAVLVAACVTCCCALIPVVTQTVLQPAFYFERAWGLCLLRQLGYDLLPPAVPAPIVSPSSDVAFAAKEEPPDVLEPR